MQQQAQQPRLAARQALLPPTIKVPPELQAVDAVVLEVCACVAARTPATARAADHTR